MQDNIIPVHEAHHAEFHDKIEKANRRLARNDIEGRFEATLVERHEYTDEETKEVYFVYDYTLNAPSFEIAGWEFLAVIELLEGGTLLRTAPGKETPKGYERPDTHICEHCNVRRYRNRSYIIRNLETGEVKQVGSACLEVFLGVEVKGLWALGFSEDLQSEMRKPISAGSWTPSRWPIQWVLAIAYVMTENGRKFISKTKANDWDTLSSADAVGNVLTFRRTKWNAEMAEKVREIEAQAAYVSKEEIEEIIQFGLSLGDSDYAQNVAAILRSSTAEGRHLGLLVSVLGVRFRSLETEKARKVEREVKVNEWAGAVKERLRKLVLTVKISRDFESDFGTKTMLVMEDEEGKTFKWISSNWLPYDAGDILEITGTVKAHEEYKGTKQTVLTRCKIDREVQVAETA